MAAKTTFDFTLEDVDSMSYRQLQKYCKSNGIKANGKADVLRNSLKNLLTVRSIDRSYVRCCLHLILDESEEYNCIHTQAVLAS